MSSTKKTLKFKPMKLDLSNIKKTRNATDFNQSFDQIQNQRQPTQSAAQVLSSWLIRIEADRPRPPFTNESNLTHDQFNFGDESKAANGQYGTVYQCRHRDFPDLSLAMKMIKINNDQGDVQRIQRELNIIKMTDHENIVTWYGSVVDSMAYGVNILMEYVDGPTVQQAIFLGGRYPMEILEYTLKKSIAALLYLKVGMPGTPVAHRDVKPSNIMFNRRGQVKVCDFGMSRIIESSAATMFVGARSYMSPEMLGDESETRQMDYYQSDMFSFSTTLLECTFGFYPYPIVTDEELKEHLDQYQPATQRPRTKEDMNDDVNQVTYMERSLEMSPFEVLEMLKELSDDSKFPDFCRDAANYFKPEFVDLLNQMSRRSPRNRINYEALVETDYYKSINVNQADVGAWVSRILQFH